MSSDNLTKLEIGINLWKFIPLKSQKIRNGRESLCKITYYSKQPQK